jgi:hypothetical protein
VPITASSASHGGSIPELSDGTTHSSFFSDEALDCQLNFCRDPSTTQGWSKTVILGTDGNVKPLSISSSDIKRAGPSTVRSSAGSSPRTTSPTCAGKQVSGQGNHAAVTASSRSVSYLLMAFMLLLSLCAQAFISIRRVPSLCLSGTALQLQASLKTDCQPTHASV